MGYKLNDYLKERGLNREKFNKFDPLTQEAIRKEHLRLVRERQSYHMSEEEYYLGDIVPFGPDGPLGIG